MSYLEYINSYYIQCPRFSTLFARVHHTLAKEIEVVARKNKEEILKEAKEAQNLGFIKNLKISSIASTVLLSFGLTTRDHDTISLVTSFALTVFTGY